MSIFEPMEYLNPKYDFLDKYTTMMYKSIWTPAAYQNLIEVQDVPYYHNVLKEEDREAIKRCILAIAIVEDKVKSYWMTLHKELPQTVISDVGGCFGLQEVTHRKSYHALVEALNIDIEEIYKYPETKGRIKYLEKYLENDPKIIGKKRILKRLVLFTVLIERISLFTQFYILTSFSHHNKGLETIGALQKSTAQEELFMHYAFGLDLINIIKEEHPQLWEEYLITQIEDNVKAAYKAELKLIDWFFYKGVPSHLDKEEVVNFLNYNFESVVKDLGLNLNYKYDRELYKEKNEWFMIRLQGLTNGDFFVNELGNYSSKEETIDIDNFNF